MHGPRQLPGLAKRHEAGTKLIRQCGSIRESSRLDCHHLIDGVTADGRRQKVNRGCERDRIGHEGSEIAKENARSRPVGNISDSTPQQLLGRLAVGQQSVLATSRPSLASRLLTHARIRAGADGARGGRGIRIAADC